MRALALLFLVACGGGASSAPADTTPALVAPQGQAARSGPAVAQAQEPTPVREAPAAAADVDLGSETRVFVPVTSAMPARGSSDALVTIVVFSDFQCPFCARARPIVDALFERYPGKLRLVWRNYPLPFHDHALPAAMAARVVYERAGNDAFWAYHDTIFDNQRALQVADLVRYAEPHHVSASAIEQAARSEQPSTQIADDLAFAEQLHIGTPTFFIDGVMIEGAQPVENFVEVIDREIAYAEALVAAGVATGDLYGQFQRGATAARPGH